MAVRGRWADKNVKCKWADPRTYMAQWAKRVCALEPRQGENAIFERGADWRVKALGAGVPRNVERVEEGNSKDGVCLPVPRGMT